MMGPVAFLRTLACSLLGLGILVVTINLCVDPYEVFGAPRIAGISRSKPATRNHTMLAKTNQVARFRPATVVIGSSPVLIGIDASAPGWPAAMEPVFNYGIPAGHETSPGFRTLQEAVATGGVKAAVVFLDFRNFLRPGKPGPALAEDGRRFRFLPDGEPNPDRPRQRVRDIFLSLATMRSLIDSLTTVAMQGQPNGLDLAPDGSGTEADFIDGARETGMHGLFAPKDVREAERAGRLVPTMLEWRGPLPDLDAVAAIIAFARTHGVTLTLVIAPHHVDALELYWRAGLWPRVDQLKTELTALASAGGGAVTLWDFLDYSTFNTESVPPAGDRRTPMSWFWEPTQFKKQLGDVMIQRMFGSDAPVFGAILTLDTVAVRNENTRVQRQTFVCEQQHPVLTALENATGDGCVRTITPHRPM